MTARDALGSLFAPASVALVGASADPMKWGGWFTMSLLDQPGRPHVELVARRGGEIRGLRVARSLSELETTPELVVLTIPKAAVDDAVDEALAAGARAIVVVAAGYGEGDEEGALAQERLVTRVRAAGARLLGPNCLGLLDTGTGLNATGGAQPPGPVSFASQSGNLALEIGMLLGEEHLGFARFVSVGNQADVTAAEILAGLVDHEPTRVPCAYVEDPVDGRAFVAALRALAEAGKPALVLEAGRSAAGAVAARSHTGALAGSSRVFAAAVRDAGGILVRSPSELVQRAKAIASPRRLAGRRVAVLADGGGHAVVATDLLVEAGFSLPPLAPETASAIAPRLPHSLPVNPVDLAGAGEMGVASFGDLTAALLADPGLDGVLVSGYFGGYAAYSQDAGAEEERVADDLAAASERTGKPLVIHSMWVPYDVPAVRRLRARGVPLYGRVEDAVQGLDAAVRRPPAPRSAARVLWSGALPHAPTYVHARAVLADAGLAFADGALARDAAEVRSIAAAIGVPVALKAVAEDLVHKTDAGGVALGLETPDAAADAAGAMLRRLRGHALDGIFVERMADAGGVDLVVGARRDPRFGPVLLVGVGGVFVEALDDVALALAPADRGHVETLLRALRAWPLLAGARGAAPVDVAAAAAAAVAVGDVVAADERIAEAEVNPLRVTPHGAVALDARIVRAG
jgi:acyl-CoA synthetase (NDP forming)